MENKKLEILVVEDVEKNLENCKKAYQPLVEKGLILPTYVTNGDEAEKYIEKVDAGILDIYFPGTSAREKIEEFAKKYDQPHAYKLDPDEVIVNNLYPLGIYYADKLAEQKKPMIFVSSIATGHGGSKNNPFYRLRDAVSFMNRKNYNPLIARAWCACESGMFITKILGAVGGHYREDIEKTEEAWLAALKAIARMTGNEGVYNAISLKDESEKYLKIYLEWMKEEKLL
jgi:CheY-like chemotaxis protein